MTVLHRIPLAGAALALAFLAPAPARAQDWRAVAQVGEVAYQGAPTSAASASALVLGVGRTDLASSLGVWVGVPVAQDDPLWGVAAASRRFEAGARVGPLLELSGHAFLQRDLRVAAPQTSTPSGPLGPILGPPPPAERTAPLSGRGAGGEATAGLFALLSPVRLEARLGVAGQRSVLAEVAESRLLPVADGRLSLEKGRVSLAAEARGWSADEGEHVYAGGTAKLALGSLVLWGSVGGWTRGGIDATPWAAGARLAIGDRLAIEASTRFHAFDPLYRTEADRSVVFATSFRLGGRARRMPTSAPVPAAYEGGRATVRLRTSDAAGRPAIAGDFTGWKPQPMKREGDHWVFGVQVAPGVYHYAFVAEDGRWFVPESVPGRQSDGMGGHVAVLVVGS